MEPYVGPRTVKRVLIFSGICCAATIVFLLAFRSLLVPLLLALFFSYLLLPLVRYIEFNLRINRLGALTIVMLLLFALLVGAVAGLIPVIQLEIRAIVEIIPRAKIMIIEHWLPWVQDLMIKTGLTDEAQANKMMNDFRFSSNFGSVSVALQHVLNQTTDLLGGIMNLALIPLFSFFILKEYENLNNFVRSLVPPDLTSALGSFIEQVDSTLKSVLKRQVTVALILAVLYSAGLAIVGLKFSLAIGVISGICRIVPYMDLFMSAVLSAVVMVTDPDLTSWSVPIGVAVVIALVQAIDGMFITPKVIGDKVGLHAAVVIASVVAFGDWLGFVGVLIAIPVAAILKIVLVASVSAYKASAYFRGK